VTATCPFHKGTLAPLCEYNWTCVSFGALESTTETGNGSVQLFLHSLRQKVPILYNGRPCPLELPLPMGIGTSHVTHDAFGPCESITQMAPRSVQSSLHRWPRSVYISQWFACFPLKIAPSHVGIWTSCNTWFTGHTRVRIANGNLIVSAVFAGLTSCHLWCHRICQSGTLMLISSTVRLWCCLQLYTKWYRGICCLWTLCRTRDPLNFIEVIRLNHTLPNTCY